MPKKISRELTVRVLDPIADVLADPQYFSRVASCFRTADRVRFLRYDNDTYAHTLVELLPLALADVSANRLRLYPRGEVLKTGHEPETGHVVETIGKRTVIRKDGRQIESFATSQEAEWWLSGNSIEFQAGVI